MSTEAPDIQADTGSAGQAQASSPAHDEPTPQFNLEPPTPTGPTLRQQQNFIDPKDASVVPAGLVAGEVADELFQQTLERGHSPSDFSSSSSLRASPLAFSRHHPYANSTSSYDDLSAAESFDGGPVRSRRTHSHASRSSFDSADGDYVPDDDSPYLEDLEPMMEQPVPRLVNGGKRTPGPREPVRLTATGKPSHARRLPPGHVKRPRNAFILFRSHACVNNLVPASLGITDHRHISRIVGQMWKSLPPEERKVWEEQAEKEKEEHRRAHPDYKYRPVYRREGVVRRRRKKIQDEKEIEEEERKCEVVARVLLEGGDISEDRVDREVEMQRERDEMEGRIRGPAAKSPVRNRRVSVPMQPAFDMNYGMVQYAQQMFDPYQMQQDTRRSNPARSSSLNVRYDVDGNAEEVDEYNDGAEVFGVPQRSHTMPPLQYNQHFYPPPPDQFAREDARSTRAPPPQPLSLYRPGDASLAPPASPGILFGVGADMQGYPVTPRTLAMQQHNLAMQQRLRGSNGTLLSPRALDFGLNARCGAAEDSNDAMLVSPTRPFQHDSSSLGFEAGFLDNALGGEANNGQHAQPSEGRAESVDMVHHQRSFSADDASANAHRSQWQNDSNEEGGQEGQQSYSALGELAAGSAAPDGGSNQSQSISFQPDADVTYVFLDAKQAQDQALVDSIRAQGFGITLDASQEDIAALASTSLAAH